MIESRIDVCNIHGEQVFKKHLNGSSKPRFRCSKCASEAVKRVVEAKREQAYDKYGRSCKICGYDKCKSALEWHHIDPSQKEIEPKKVFNRSWERIQEELDKCVLLCSNCHREIHAGITELSTQ